MQRELVVVRFELLQHFGADVFGIPRAGVFARGLDGRFRRRCAPAAQTFGRLNAFHANIASRPVRNFEVARHDFAVFINNDLPTASNAGKLFGGICRAGSELPEREGGRKRAGNYNSKKPPARHLGRFARSIRAARDLPACPHCSNGACADRDNAEHQPQNGIAGLRQSRRARRRRGRLRTLQGHGYVPFDDVGAFARKGKRRRKQRRQRGEPEHRSALPPRIPNHIWPLPYAGPKAKQEHSPRKSRTEVYQHYNMADDLANSIPERRFSSITQTATAAKARCPAGRLETRNESPN